MQANTVLEVGLLLELSFHEMQLPNEIPVLILPQVTLFPGTMLPLHIFEPRYRRMLDGVLETHRMFSVAMQNPNRVRESPCKVAGLGLVRASVQNKNGTSNLILQGLARIKLLKVARYKPYRVHVMERIEPEDALQDEWLANLTSLMTDQVKELLETGYQLPTMILKKMTESQPSAPANPIEHLSVDSILKHLTELNSVEQMADMISSTLLTNPLHRQSILETPRLEQRLKALVGFLKEEIIRRNQSWNS